MTASAKSPHRGFVAVAVCVAGLLAYANSFTNGFVWDDASSVLLHKHVQDPGQFFQLFREDQHAFGRGQGNFYRPLVSASFMLDFALARSTLFPASAGHIPDISPFLFHVTNLVWHVAAALLLLALLARLDAPPLVSVCVPLLYVVHPLHTEAVTYISGRADPMSASFMFLALWFGLAGRTPVRRMAAAAGCWISFAAALLCKESAFVLPALLLLAVFIPARRDDSGAPTGLIQRLIPAIGAFAILAVYAFLRSGPLNFVKASAPEAAAPFDQRLVETGQAFASYLGLVFAPTHLHMERALTGAPVWLAGAGYLLMVAGIAGAVIAYRLGQRRITLGLAWFLITWLPISGLFPLNAPMAEHWMYVPLAGFLWALAELLALTWRSGFARAAIPAAVFAALLVFVTLTAQRNRDWRSNESLYSATLDENPNSARVHFNLAVTYEDILKNLPGARRHYRSVLALAARKGAGAVSTNEEIESHLSLGQIALKLGDYQDAAQHFQPLLALPVTDSTRPIIATAALGIGKCFLGVGDIQKAAASFEQAAIIPEFKAETDSLIAGKMLPGAI
ncbi:MAG: tetratricopeptide repeat protein [Candidatus Hydrogenedentes bacterium]|nr:tetratricopeptide repeat protein [Candidatus Hydrogenedentota bacterium]